jgi:hypothetical protein
MEAGESERAEALLLLFQSRFAGESGPSIQSVAEIRLRRELAQGDALLAEEAFDAALDAYDRALVQSEGDARAFARLVELRTKLTGYTKDNGEWIPTETLPDASPDRALVLSRYRRWQRHTIVTSRGVPRLLRHQRASSSGSVQGVWSLRVSRAGERESWVIHGHVELENRSWNRPLGPIRIGVALLDQRRELLEAGADAVPYLLPGNRHSFEVRVPRVEGEKSIAVGLVVTDR